MTSTDSIPPADLVEAAATGHLVILVGAGASRSSGLPSWSELLTDLFKEAQSASLAPEVASEVASAESWFREDGDHLEKASFLRQTLGDSWLSATIARRFNAANAAPTGTHVALAQVPGAAFITTNYDKLLEQALAEHTGKAPTVVLLSDVDGIRDFGPGQVLKLHGDQDSPASIVLSREDYFRVSHQTAPAWKHRLQSLLQGRHRLLLVGYGYGDIDVQFVVDELRAAYGDKLPGPFWLERETIQARTKARSAGLAPIWVKEHSAIPAWLSEFAIAVERAKARTPAVLKSVAYADHLREHLQAAQKHAGDLFEAESYEDARNAYSALLEEAESLLKVDPDSAELRRLAAASVANVAICRLCLQEPEDARLLLERVVDAQLSDLSLSAKCVTAEALAQLGDIDRALRVLDSEPSPEPTERLQHARVLVDILAGHLPEALPAEAPILALTVARVSLDRGDLVRATQAAHQALRDANDHGLVQLYSLMVLEQALGGSVFEITNRVSDLSESERTRVLGTIESRLGGLETLLKTPSHKRDRVRLAASFYELTQDEENVERLAKLAEHAGLDPHDHTPPDTKRFLQAQDLAESGKLADALSLLMPSSHPWTRAWEVAYLHALANDFETALRDVLALCDRYPARAPIEYLAAKLLARASRADEAVPHAASAFRALPGRGYRLLLGQCLLAAGQRENAAEVLAPLADSSDFRVLRARASALESNDAPKAVDVWTRYVEARPTDINARLHLAQLVFHIGRHAESADAAWTLAQAHKDTLSPLQLYQCAQLQLIGRPRDAETIDRVRQIASCLDERFPSNLQAEKFRLLLRASLGFEDGGRPVNYEGLVAAGELRAGTFDELVQVIRRDAELRQSAYNAYRLGQLPFESLCGLTQTSAAVYVSRFVDVAETLHRDVLSPPVTIADAEPPSLDGVRILVSQLEVLLLHTYELLPRLASAIGRGGRLVMFADVWERMAADAADLSSRAQRVEYRKQEAFLEKLRSDYRIRIERTDKFADDDQWAAATGVPLVEADPVPGGVRLSPRAIVAWLRSHGHIDAAQHDRALRSLAAEQPEQPFGNEIPPRIAASYTFAAALFEASALDALLDCLSELIIPPSCIRIVEGRKEELRQAVVAADLAASAHRAIGAGIEAGWIECRLQRPIVEGLPPLRDGLDVETSKKLYAEPFGQALSYRQALLDDPSLWLLTADCFVSTPIGAHVTTVMQFAWPTPDAYLRLAQTMLDLAPRELHLPVVLRLMLDGTEAFRHLLKLAELGFVDALRPSDLIALAERFGGLDKAVPRRILDRLEWVARQSQHVDSPFAWLRLATTYSGALWESSKVEGRELQARSLAEELLRRAEAVGPEALDRTIAFAIAQVGETPRLSFGPLSEDETLSLSFESPGGRVWKLLGDFAAKSPSRKAAFARAVRHAWLMLDEFCGPDGPDRVRFATLLLAPQLAPSHAKEAVLEAPAILSGCWRHKPLSDIHDSQGRSVEDVLSRLATIASETPPRVAIDEALLGAISDSGDMEGDIAPPEAVLLRMAPAPASSMAVFLATKQGPHDGVAHRLLASLAQQPQNAAVRREYARRSVIAPWRLFREDPAIIRSWAWRGRFGDGSFPATLDDLRHLLSEPGPLPAGLSLWDVLMNRIGDGGSWAERTDAETLFRMASEVPGVLPAAPVVERLRAPKSHYAREVSASLHRLQHQEDHPAARLAGDVFFLRIASVLQPRVKLASGEVDLRELLPERFLELFASALGRTEAFGTFRTSVPENPSTDDTLASAEAELLFTCALVVRDLAHLQNVLIKDGIWLTYRLHQWVCMQLRGMDPDARRNAIRILRARPTSEMPDPASDDIANPLGFPRSQFNYRLVTLLCAIGTMDEVLSQISKALDLSTEPARSVSSPGIENALIPIVCGEISESDRRVRRLGDSPSCVDWYGPGALPDLALMALLTLNRSAFFRLPPEVRLRWILDLPRSRGDRDRVSWSLAARLMGTLTVLADNLTAEERGAFEEKLRHLERNDDRQADIWYWLGLSKLFEVGQGKLRDEVRNALVAHLDNEAAPMALGSYLLGLTRIAPDELESETQHLLAAARVAGADPVKFAPAIGNVVVVGDGAAVQSAKRTLLRLAEQEPFRGDERMTVLLTSLGVKREG